MIVLAHLWQLPLVLFVFKFRYLQALPDEGLRTAKECCVLLCSRFSLDAYPAQNDA